VVTQDDRLLVDIGAQFGWELLKIEAVVVSCFGTEHPDGELRGLELGVGSALPIPGRCKIIGSLLPAEELVADSSDAGQLSEDVDSFVGKFEVPGRLCTS